MVDSSQIREHMEVYAADGTRVGTVDHLEGPDRIKLTKNDTTSHGKHHFIPLAWVETVDNHVHLNRGSEEVEEEWEEAA